LSLKAEITTSAASLRIKLLIYVSFVVMVILISILVFSFINGWAVLAVLSASLASLGYIFIQICFSIFCIRIVKLLRYLFEVASFFSSMIEKKTKKLRSLDDTFSPFDRERNSSLKRIGTSLIFLSLLMFLFPLGIVLDIPFNFVEVPYPRIVPIFFINISGFGACVTFLWALYVPPPFSCLVPRKNETVLRTGFLISETNPEH